MMKLKLGLSICLIIMVLLIQGSEVQAMDERRLPAEASAVLTLEKTAVTTFVDAFVAKQMADRHVPGAAIVIVQGDAVVFAQGYGLADLAQQTPVDVSQTLFRAGSVSKLFTATAVMQLVEQGKIDLDGDINQYLHSLQLPDKFDRPITVADLLLHTTGLDDVFLGMHEREAVDLQSLAEFLQTHLPEQYDPPGELISYNDHGYTLAGLLIEDVTGQTFPDYMAEHVLAPLQMGDSSFAQPLPAALQERMAVGYRFGDAYEPYAFDYVQVGPAAALSAPATDIAHFMIAHLNDGVYAGQAILQPETVAEMQKTQFAHHPALRGRGYGFSEWRENGRRAVFHDGGNPGFLSRLMLFPEEGIGFYLSYNGDQYSGAAQFHRAFTTQFMDTFLPETEETAVLPQAVALDRPAADFAGYYRDVPAYSHDTLQKLTSLMNQFPVTTQGEQLAVFGREYVPTSPLLFASNDGESIMAFRENEAGAISHLFVGTGAYVKLPWYETQPVQLGMVIWFLLLFLSAIGAGLVWRTAPGLLRGTLAATGLLNLIFLAGMAFALLQMDPWQFVYGPSPVVVVLLVLPLVTCLLSLAVMALFVSGWSVGAWGWGIRLYTAVLSLTLIGFPLFLNFWNLLGFRY